MLIILSRPHFDGLSHFPITSVNQIRNGIFSSEESQSWLERVQLQDGERK